MCDGVEQCAACTCQRLGPIAGLAQIVRAFFDGALQFDPVVFLGLAGLRALDDTAELLAEGRGDSTEVWVLRFGTAPRNSRTATSTHSTTTPNAKTLPWTTAPRGRGSRSAWCPHCCRGPSRARGPPTPGPSGPPLSPPVPPGKNQSLAYRPTGRWTPHTRVVAGGDEQMAHVPFGVPTSIVITSVKAAWSSDAELDAAADRVSRSRARCRAYNRRRTPPATSSDSCCADRSRSTRRELGAICARASRSS